MLYDRIKRSNNEQKIRMIKRLNSVYTKSISNKQVVNSIEEYTSCYDRSIEDANPSKLKQFLAFLKKIVKIILNAIGNFINKFTSIFTGKIKYYTKFGTFSWNKKYNSVNIETLLKNKFIIDIINSKICIAKPNLSNLEKTYKEYIDCISELDSTEKHIGIMGGRGYDDSQKRKYIAYVRDTTIEILKKLENIFQTHESNNNEHVSNQQSIIKSFFDYESLPYKTNTDGHVIVGDREIKKIIKLLFNDNTDNWMKVGFEFGKKIRNALRNFEDMIDDIEDIIDESKDKELIDIHQQLSNQLGATLKNMYSFSNSFMQACLNVSGVISTMGSMFFK